MWYAKNTGGYDLYSIEAEGNANEICNILTPLSYVLSAICAILGNIRRECDYNPWQWENNDIRTTSNYHSFTGGYGLMQWTPCYEYIDSSTAQGYSTYSPNFLDSPGTASDGDAQILFMNHQCLGNDWFAQTPGSNQYNAYLNRLSSIGIDYTRFYNMTFAQFKAGSGPQPNITYTRDDWLGAFATNYLRCNSYELADKFSKMSIAYNYWYEYFSGNPPSPDPPIPVLTKHKMPVWMMIKYY